MQGIREIKDTGFDLKICDVTEEIYISTEIRSLQNRVKGEKTISTVTGKGWEVGEGGIQHVSQVCCLGGWRTGSHSPDKARGGGATVWRGMWEGSHRVLTAYSLSVGPDPVYGCPGKAVPGGLSPLLL